MRQVQRVGSVAGGPVQVAVQVVRIGADRVGREVALDVQMADEQAGVLGRLCVEALVAEEDGQPFVRACGGRIPAFDCGGRRLVRAHAESAPSKRSAREAMKAAMLSRLRAA